jgi:hypothetical protein
MTSNGSEECLFRVQNSMLHDSGQGSVQSQGHMRRKRVLPAAQCMFALVSGRDLRNSDLVWDLGLRAESRPARCNEGREIGR